MNREGGVFYTGLTAVVVIEGVVVGGGAWGTYTCLMIIEYSVSFTRVTERSHNISSTIVFAIHRTTFSSISKRHYFIDTNHLKHLESEVSQSSFEWHGQLRI